MNSKHKDKLEVKEETAEIANVPVSYNLYFIFAIIKI